MDIKSIIFLGKWLWHARVLPSFGLNHSSLGLNHSSANTQGHACMCTGRREVLLIAVKGCSEVTAGAITKKAIWHFKLLSMTERELVHPWVLPQLARDANFVKGIIAKRHLWNTNRYSQFVLSIKLMIVISSGCLQATKNIQRFMLQAVFWHNN